MLLKPGVASTQSWRDRLRTTSVVLCALTLLLATPAGLARGEAASLSPSAKKPSLVLQPTADRRAAASSVTSTHIPPPLPGMFQCSGEHPCHFPAGRYELALGEIIPGLRLTLPPNWSSQENDIAELNLVPPGHPDDGLFIWVDMVAVKSTGPGHGTTVLTDVGKTPRALTRWLTTNPDFNVVTRPRNRRLGNIPMRTLSVNISPTANYGDPGCPGNPHCVDFFTRPIFWGPNFFGIGGASEDRFYLGTIRISGAEHTMMVALDGGNHADLLRLERDARPILRSLHLPNCHRRHPGC